MPVAAAKEIIMHIKPAVLRFIVSLLVFTALYSGIGLAEDSKIVSVRRQNQVNIVSITMHNSSNDLPLLEVERFEGARRTADERDRRPPREASDVEVPYGDAPLIPFP
jgi:hypothetical protein